MAVQLQFKFDGGMQQYNRALKSLVDGVKDFKPLFQDIIDYFEGYGDATLDKPINKIYDTKGGIIGGNWTNSPKYEKLKDKIWKDRRKITAPYPKWEQILSGMQLAALLNSRAKGAVRVLSNFAMMYGVQNDYTHKQQAKKKVLDFYPKMIRDIDRITARWIAKMGLNEVDE